jgi:hypothetical protein
MKPEKAYSAFVQSLQSGGRYIGESKQYIEKVESIQMTPKTESAAFISTELHFL